MKPVVKEDLMKYRFLSAVTANEAGTQAVYVETHMVKDGYKSDLWLIDTASGKTAQLTHDGFAGGPVWEDDATVLYRTKGKGKTALKHVDVNTKAISDAFEIEYPVMAVKPLGNGKYLLNAEVDLKKEGFSKDQLKAEEDYLVVEEIPFWDNGAGYVTRIRSSLFIYDSASAAMELITDKFFQTSGFEVVGNSVYYAGNGYDSVGPNTSGLYKYDMSSGLTETVIDPSKGRVSWLHAANGVVYFCFSDLKTYGNGQHGDFWRLDDSCPEKMRKLAPNELTLGCNVSSDCRKGGGANTAAWNNKLLYVTTAVDVCNMHTIDPEGNTEDLPRFEGAVECLSAAGDNIIFTAMKNCRLQEIWLYDSSNGKYRQLTKRNSAALAGRYVGKPVYCGFTDKDGVKIDGWVIKPIDFDPDKKYPGVLSMHGGPRVVWGRLFVHEMQMLAGAGYFVFYCNPRGSDGRGEAFADLRGKYGDIDFKDFMEFTDHVLKKYPQLNADKLSAIGGSYGGYMANWMVGNTDRFAAIVSQRSFCNPLSDFGYSCIGYTFDRDQFDADPWSDPWKMWEHAPLKYACNAKTPTLFIHSMEDYNCPLPEGLQMFTALKYHGCEAKMCLFKGENHELSRSGKPAHRMRRLQEIQAWLDAHQK